MRYLSGGTLPIPYRCMLQLHRAPAGFGGHSQHGLLYNIKLLDMTAGMQRPCVMDIKMGKRTFLESGVLPDGLVVSHSLIYPPLPAPHAHILPGAFWAPCQAS